MLCKKGNLGQGALVAFFKAVPISFLLVSCVREEIKALGSLKKSQGREGPPTPGGPMRQVKGR